MPAASSDGPPNRANPASPTPLTASHDPRPSPGAKTSAKAFATLPPGFIPASTATANLRWLPALGRLAPTGFMKPFVTVEYRYN